MFHGIWLSLKNKIDSGDSQKDCNQFSQTIETIKKLDDEVKKQAWINTLENFTIFRKDFSLHKKNIDLVVILHPNIQKVVYRFLECLNNSGSRLYNLKQYDYLISIIAKLEKYTYVLQDMVLFQFVNILWKLSII